MLAGSFGAVSGLIRMSSFLLVQRGDLSQNAQTELASNRKTDVDREQAGGWGVGVGKGAGEGIEQNRKKKRERPVGHRQQCGECRWDGVGGGRRGDREDTW